MVTECDRTTGGMGGWRRPSSGLEGYKAKQGICSADLVYKSEPETHFWSLVFIAALKISKKSKKKIKILMKAFTFKDFGISIDKGRG